MHLHITTSDWSISDDCANVVVTNRGGSNRWVKQQNDLLNKGMAIVWRDWQVRNPERETVQMGLSCRLIRVLSMQEQRRAGIREEPGTTMGGTRNYDGRNTGTTMGGTQELRWEEHRNYDGRNTGTTMGGTQELRWEEHRNYDGRNTNYDGGHRNYDGRNTGTTMGGTQELRWEEHRNYDGRNTGTTMEEHRNYDGRNTGTTMGGTQELRWEEHRNYDGRNTGTTMGGTQELRWRNTGLRYDGRNTGTTMGGTGLWEDTGGSQENLEGKYSWVWCLFR